MLGPFILKEHTERSWKDIFSCLSSWAVSLEVVHMIETNPFIRALRRFIARFISDVKMAKSLWVHRLNFEGHSWRGIKKKTLFSPKFGNWLDYWEDKPFMSQLHDWHIGMSNSISTLHTCSPTKEPWDFFEINDRGRIYHKFKTVNSWNNEWHWQWGIVSHKYNHEHKYACSITWSFHKARPVW